MLEILNMQTAQVRLGAMRERAAETGAEINRTAAEVLEAVRLRGYSAVEEYSLKFDKATPYELTTADLEKAEKACAPELIRALERSAANVLDYQKRLLDESKTWQSPSGGMVGRLVRPLGRVGVYVPGGRAAYPSSVIMNVVPAKAAGVEEVIMVTPPTSNLNNAVLAAAKIAGADRVIAVGGIQAIGAMVYGAGFIPKVDKLVGPGNAYVTAAKRMAFGNVDIDMTAGPSEIMIIADKSARPDYVAADMLSQAEHDPLASAILLTTSEALAEKTATELARQLIRLERRDIAGASLRDYGAIILCQSLEECAALANQIAPEHLELMTESPRALLPLIKNAGAIFLGENSPEPLGDYMAGPSHVLPTSGTARFFSPLSAESFLKKMSIIDFGKASLSTLCDDITILAEAEGFTAHAEAIRVRFK